MPTEHEAQVTVSTDRAFISISDEHRKALEYFRRRAGLRESELVRELRGKVTSRTLQNIRNKPNHRARIETLECIARVLHVEVEDILEWPNSQARRMPAHDSLNQISTFRKCADVLKEIDKNVMKFMRSVGNNVPADVMHRGYIGILDQELNAFRLPSTVTFLSKLSDLTRNQVFLDSVPQPDLVIEVDEYFQEIHFCWPRNSLKIQHPKLLWDCSCEAGRKENNSSDCPIHASPHGTDLTKRFRKGLVLICWRGIEFLWRNEKALWPPSIDSFHMMNNLLLYKMNDLHHVKNLLDIGSGTGFLGISAAHFLSNVEQVALQDWLLSPALYGLVNWHRNSPSLASYCDITPRLGIHTRPIEPSEDDFELLLCNPPYLPLLEGHELMAGESAVAGTDLLEQVILNCRSLAENVYLQFSELARPEALRAQSTAGVKLTEVGEPASVPFRVNIAFDDPGYVEDLLRARRNNFVLRKNDRYPYWHTVRTYRIEQ